MTLATIPGVLTYWAPRGETVPCVFDSPHSGSHYPDDFRTIQPPSVYRRGEDAHIDALYAAAPEKGAVLMAAVASRVYLDPNRTDQDIDPDMLDGPWPTQLTPTVKTRNGQGLITRLAPPDLPLYDRKLSVAEVKHRIDTYYTPYHATLKAALDATHAAFGRVYHVNCHSMPAMSSPMSPEGPGVARADFVLGDLDGTTSEPGFTETVRAVLTDLGYDVAVNNPYKGVELVRAYSDPPAGRNSLQIEINRKLYMDETTFERNARFDALKGHLEQMMDAIIAYARDRAA
ncbi:MAG: N-formylglutamate amidohydrolase [Rhodobacterales bacterium]|nr:N-formylglutamate amidohydrolase [Rhodobacterales bacterium]